MATTRSRWRWGVAVLGAAALLSVTGVGCGSDFRERVACRESEDAVVRAASLGAHNDLQDRLDGGGDANAADADGNTPLGCASVEGDLASVRILLAAGASPTKRSQVGGRPIVAAISGEPDWQLLRTATQGPADGRDEHFASLGSASRRQIVALLLARGVAPTIAVAPAVWSGDRELLQGLLRAGGSPEGEADHEVSPLALAAYNGDRDAIQMLLDAGAGVDEGGMADRATGILLLFSMIDADAAGGRSGVEHPGEEAVVRDLLSNDAPNQSRVVTVTPLLAAVLHFQGKAVTDLLARGANVETPFRDRFPPLWTAVFSEQREVVRQLLAHGADPDRDLGHGSARSLAHKLDDPEMAALFDGDSPKPTTTTPTAPSTTASATTVPSTTSSTSEPSTTATPTSAPPTSTTIAPVTPPSSTVPVSPPATTTVP